MKETAMDRKGVTLVELIVVISIIGILAAALAFSYQGWTGRYKVEKQIREVNADLMQARANALERKRNYFVWLAATSYSVYEDTNPGPDGDGTLQTASDTRVLSRNTESGLTLSDNVVGTTIAFNTRGLTNNLGTICCSGDDFDADYDCVVISESRINLGKLSNPGGTCDAANCVAK